MKQHFSTLGLRRFERQKMEKTVCFCYGYTDEAIREDVHRHHGRSLIHEAILAARQQGVCQCAVRHPQGR